MSRAEPLLLNALVAERLAQRRARVGAVAALALVLVGVVVVATGLGSTDVSMLTVLRLLWSRLSGADVAGPVATIVFDIRLPRALLAALVGAALATAGATYQGLFRNSLADPYLIGVAQGAGLGAIVGFLLPLGEPTLELWLVPLLAFGGGLASGAVVYLLARVGGVAPLTTLILAGVAVGAFLAAITSYLLLVSGEKLHGILFWLMGGFGLSHWAEVQVLLPYVAVGSAVIYVYAQPLNLMQLDEEQAQQLGVNVERTKLVLLVAATLVTAAAVAFAGSIGFVGLIVPHAVRLVWGPDHRFLLPLSGLGGATFLVAADVLVRTVLGPAEVPVGVVTAFCGAPFFLYLLRRRQRLVF